MLPDISIRINSLIKAMEAIIAPAIQPGNALAKEQAELVIGHLKLLNTQWDMAYLYERSACKEMEKLGLELIAIADGGSKVQKLKRSLENDLKSLIKETCLTSDEVKNQTIVLGNAIDDLIYAGYEDGTDSFKNLMGSIILSIGEKQVMLDRTWFRATELDPEAKKLPTIEEMLVDKSVL